jgi:hypothetical protein
MAKFCYSCTNPIKSPLFGRSDTNYCNDCIDNYGNLLPRETIRDGIAKWLQSWEGNISYQTAYERAGHFMKAMPAWAED